MSRIYAVLIIIGFIAVIGLSMSLFTVDERERAIVLLARRNRPDQGRIRFAERIGQHRDFHCRKSL
jgi:hypothetical protein